MSIVLKSKCRDVNFQHKEKRGEKMHLTIRSFFLFVFALFFTLSLASIAFAETPSKSVNRKGSDIKVQVIDGQKELQEARKPNIINSEVQNLTGSQEIGTLGWDPPTAVWNLNSQGAYRYSISGLTTYIYTNYKFVPYLDDPDGPSIQLEINEINTPRTVRIDMIDSSGNSYYIGTFNDLCNIRIVHLDGSKTYYFKFTNANPSQGSINMSGIIF